MLIQRLSLAYRTLAHCVWSAADYRDSMTLTLAQSTDAVLCQRYH